MRYSTRVLGLIDMLAMVLAGTGVLCLVLAAFTIILAGGAGPNRYGQDPRLWMICYITVGITFTCLGAALNLQLIRVRANGGREPGAGSCGSPGESRPVPDAMPIEPPANRSRRRWLFRIACLAVAAAALWLASAFAVAYRLSRRIGAPYPEPAPSLAHGSAEAIRLATRDGEELGAWFIDGGDSAPLVLLLHGNGDDRGACLRQAEIASRAGCPVLLISFRAHGDSTGELNDFGLSARHDVIAAVEWLETRKPGRRIVAWGLSLGAAAAMFAAEALGERVSGYVLECPYRDLRTAVRRRTAAYLPPVFDGIAYLGLVAVSPLVLPDPDAIAPIEAAARMPPGVPVLILAGTADDRAPPDEAEEIRLRMKCPSELVVIEGGTHGRLIDARTAAYEEAVSRFLERAKAR